MATILFLKARDPRDTATGDLFGTHLETRTRKDGVVQRYHVAAPAAPAIPDGHSKKFYVTMIRDPGPRQRVARLAGPFDDHDAALAHVEPARRLARELDPWSDFDAFGTAGVTAAEHRPGVLNERLGIGAALGRP
jgi:hypothetical protein